MFKFCQLFYFILFQMLIFAFSLFFYYQFGNEMEYIGWHKKLFITHIWIESLGGKKEAKYKCESASKKNKMAIRTFQVQHKLAALPHFGIE